MQIRLGKWTYKLNDRVTSLLGGYGKINVNMCIYIYYKCICNQTLASWQLHPHPYLPRLGLRRSLMVPKNECENPIFVTGICGLY